MKLDLFHKLIIILAIGFTIICTFPLLYVWGVL